jgi:hypothetical protein
MIRALMGIALLVSFHQLWHSTTHLSYHQVSQEASTLPAADDGHSASHHKRSKDNTTSLPPDERIEHDGIPNNVSTNSSEETIAIFYNVYTAPGMSNLTLSIVKEQLDIWRQSSNSIAQTAILYYALLGEEIQMPCTERETCKRLENINATGNEEETLQSLYNYCLSHPQDKVI